jgi:hypothetical protein
MALIEQIDNNNILEPMKAIFLFIVLVVTGMFIISTKSEFVAIVSGLQYNSSQQSYDLLTRTLSLCNGTAECFETMACLYKNYSGINMFEMDIATDFNSCNFTDDNPTFSFMPGVFVMGLDAYGKLLSNIQAKFCNTSASCLNELCMMEKGNPKMIYRCVIPISNGQCHDLRS